jgi:hypothetical protein
MDGFRRNGRGPPLRLPVERAPVHRVTAPVGQSDGRDPLSSGSRGAAGVVVGRMAPWLRHSRRRVPVAVFDARCRLRAGDLGSGDPVRGEAVGRRADEFVRHEVATRTGGPARRGCRCGGFGRCLLRGCVLASSSGGVLRRLNGSALGRNYVALHGGDFDGRVLVRQVGRRCASGRRGNRAPGRRGRRAGGRPGRRAGGKRGSCAGGRLGRRAGGRPGCRVGGKCGSCAGGRRRRCAGKRRGRSTGGRRRRCVGGRGDRGRWEDRVKAPGSRRGTARDGPGYGPEGRRRFGRWAGDIRRLCACG